MTLLSPEEFGRRLGLETGLEGRQANLRGLDALHVDEVSPATTASRELCGYERGSYSGAPVRPGESCSRPLVFISIP